MPATVLSRAPWRLQGTGGDTTDVTFDVEGAITWTRQRYAREATALCGGAPVISSRGVGPRRAHVSIVLPHASDRNSRRDTLEAAWASIPPQSYTLTLYSSSVQYTITFDPTVNWEESIRHGHYFITVGFLRVG